MKPKRSIVFVATSGGAPGQLFWGSHAYLSDRDNCMPILSTTIDLRVGGPVMGDTAVLTGLEEVQMVPLPTWVVSFHPELGLTIVGGGRVTEPRSDAFTFRRRNIPSLLLQGSMMEDSNAGHVSEALSAGGLDLERTARLLRLVFYISQGVIDIPERPRWTAIGRQRLYGGR